MTQLAGLLALLCEEFARMGDEVDDVLMRWLGAEPEDAPDHARAAGATWERLAAAMRVIDLEGQAQVLELLRDSAQLLAMSDAQSMGAGLGWLLGWQSALAGCVQQPGQAQPVTALLGYLRAGPMAPGEDALADLAQWLALPASLAADEGEALTEPWPYATPEELSLALPEDLDTSLFNLFLLDAPEQAALLSQAVRALQHGGALPAERLQEVQRVAHTFKGSGNIIGLLAIARMAHRIEDVLDFARQQHGQLPPAMAQDLAQACDSLEQMLAALLGQDEAPSQACAQLNRLTDWMRATEDGSWRTLAPAPAPTPSPEPAASTAPTTPAAPPHEAPAASTRLPMARLDRLVRQAGQALVQQNRLDGQLQHLGQDLANLQNSQDLLSQHLHALTVQLQRQQVSLHTQASSASPSHFDPLELDRYTELHSLAQLLAEQLHDAQHFAHALQTQAQQSQTQLREHASLLKQQHEELLTARLVPFRQIVARLRRNVSQTAASTGKQAQLLVEGEAVLVDSDVLERLAEPLLHLLRNAVDHGIEPPELRLQRGKPAQGTVRLQLSRDGQTLRLHCSDDGQGLDAQAIARKAQTLGLLAAEQPLDEAALYRLILLPGFSTREAVSQVSGRGVGMDVVAQRIQAMKGRIDIHSQAGQGSHFQLSVPASAGNQHALVVQVAGQLLALPTRAVQHALSSSQVWREGAQLCWREQRWPHARLADWLGLVAPAHPPRVPDVVVIHGTQAAVALEVDAVLEARELIVQDVGRLLRAVPGLLSGALTREGRVLFLFDPAQLEQHARRSPQALANHALANTLAKAEPVQRPRVLVVDDSLSVRQSLTQLLEDAGWQVHSARDGLEALSLLANPTLQLDALLTDLEMPRLNGLDLTRQLRSDARWQRLPVLMLSSRSSDKHRQSALALGVDTYLSKPCPDAELLRQLQAALPTRSVDSSRAA